MDELVIARIIHVVTVLFWIGGVGFVTWVIIPAITASELPGNRLAKFYMIEGRFAAQARMWELLAGASGFWLGTGRICGADLPIRISGGCMRWSRSGRSLR